MIWSAADNAAKRFHARHADLRSRYQGRPQVAVSYQITESPLLTINDHQMISDVIRLCGGRNVVGKEPMLVPQGSTESVVSVNPDVILAAQIGEHNADGDHPVRAPGDVGFAMWDPLSTLKASQRGQHRLVPANPISRRGPRILDGGGAVCGALEEARRTR